MANEYIINFINNILCRDVSKNIVLWKSIRIHDFMSYAQNRSRIIKMVCRKYKIKSKQFAYKLVQNLGQVPKKNYLVKYLFTFRTIKFIIYLYL